MLYQRREVSIKLSDKYRNKLKEKSVTKISKKDIPDRFIKSGWITDENLIIYKLSESSKVISDIKTTNNGISFGVFDSDIYFWKGDVYQKVVETMFNSLLHLCLYYSLGDDSIILLDFLNATADSFKEYLRTNEALRKIIMNIMKQVPQIKYLEYRKEKILLRDFQI